MIQYWRSFYRYKILEKAECRSEDSRSLTNQKGLDLPDIFYCAEVAADIHAFLRPLSPVQKSTLELEDLERLFSLEPGNHEAACDWLFRYGEWRALLDGSPPRGDFLPARNPCNGEWPSLWWAETLWIRRAMWLHRFLTDTSEEGEVFSQKSEHLCIRVAAEPPSENLPFGDPAMYLGVRWPKEHSLDWLNLRLSSPRFIEPAERVSPVVYLWQCLASILDDGVSRNSTRSRILFDREKGCVIQDTPDERPGLASAAWELLTRKVLGERPPVRCEICGELVRAKRITRRYCKKAKCRKAAQRRREKERNSAE